MNRLIVGRDKSGFLEDLPDEFLLIDDGTLIDALDIDPKPRRFDVFKNSFNPLKDMDYVRACAFISVLDGVFPEGRETLTRRSSNFLLMQALLGKAERLGRLLSDSKDPHQKDAYQRIQRLLLSPVLNHVLNRSRAPSYSMEGTIVARLDRSKIGRFDAFVLGNLLMSAYPGHVIVPDFGFYACEMHKQLLDENRLFAGVNFLDEAPALRDRLILIEQVLPAHCTSEDAELLADHHSGFIRKTDGHTTYVQRAIGLIS